LIVGVAWTIFHLPLFFTKGAPQEDTSFVSFAISTISLSVLFTWLYNHTRGSVLLAYMFHASVNTWSQVFSLDRTIGFIDWSVTGSLVLVVVIVVIANGAENLSRSGMRIRE
jgi:hypothetical protein